MPKGKLFYVIGASGAGKDSLMNHARQQLAGSQPIVFAHRYITRPAEAGGENHISLFPAEFNNRKALGLFAMEWESHGQQYGIGIEIKTWLVSGINVVVNGSREYLSVVGERFPEMSVILIRLLAKVVLSGICIDKRSNNCNSKSKA